MGQAVGQILPLAVGVALSPVPIVGVILMLATPRARPNALAFLAGWIVALAGIGAIVLLLSSGISASDNGQPKTWVSVLQLVLGAGLLLLALRQWRARPRGGEASALPKWMGGVRTFTPPQ